MCLSKYVCEIDSVEQRKDSYKIIAAGFAFCISATPFSERHLGSCNDLFVKICALVTTLMLAFKVNVLFDQRSLI